MGTEYPISLDVEILFCGWAKLAMQNFAQILEWENNRT